MGCHLLLAEGSVKALLNFPCAKRLSLAKKVKAPSIKHKPEWKIVLELICEVLKKQKNPAIVSKTKQDPQTANIQIKFCQSGLSDFTIVLILQKEKVTRTSQMPMKRGYCWSTSLIVILFSVMSLVVLIRLGTQIKCPIRKAPAPSAKKAEFDFWKSKKISPREPKKRPQMIVQIYLWTCLSDQSWIMSIQTGKGFTYFRTLSIF